jgi:hypothetical protein
MARPMNADEMLEHVNQMQSGLQLYLRSATVQTDGKCAEAPVFYDFQGRLFAVNPKSGMKHPVRRIYDHLSCEIIYIVRPEWWNATVIRLFDGRPAMTQDA